MMLISRFSDPSLRMQIALVFGTLVVGLSVLLSLGFGELLKHRIQRDAGNSLQVVAENAGKLLALGLMQRSLEAEVMASAEVVWSKGLDSAEAQHMLARSQAMLSWSSSLASPRWRKACATSTIEIQPWPSP